MDQQTTLNALIYALQGDDPQVWLTATSCVSCKWDRHGIFVCLQNAGGVLADSEPLFAVYESEEPGEQEWLDAMEIARGLSDEFDIPLSITIED